MIFIYFLIQNSQSIFASYLSILSSIVSSSSSKSSTGSFYPFKFLESYFYSNVYEKNIEELKHNTIPVSEIKLKIKSLK